MVTKRRRSVTLDLSKLAMYAGAIVAIGSALTVLDHYSPWAWAGEFRELASISCRQAQNQIWDLILITQAQRDKAKANKQTDLALSLDQQIARLQAELQTVQQKCALWQQQQGS